MRHKFVAILVALACHLCVVSAASASEKITYSYDAKGRLIQVQHAGSINDNLVVTYSFDLADNRTNAATTGATRRTAVIWLDGFRIISSR